MSGQAEELKSFLESEGVIVRYYSSPPELSGCIRVSVGLLKLGYIRVQNCNWNDFNAN